MEKKEEKLESCLKMHPPTDYKQIAELMSCLRYKDPQDGLPSLSFAQTVRAVDRACMGVRAKKQAEDDE